MISSNKLTIINPDEQLDMVTNMPFDESMDVYDSDYISSDEETDKKLLLPTLSSKEKINENLFPPIPPSKEEENNDVIKCKGINVGNGKMDYIKNNYEKSMITNAWQAITQTETWDFVSQNIDSFMISNDHRINIILNKMEELGYDGHSGCSFCLTMRNMQFLAQKGEEEFKKLFEKPKMD
jgi:hypothetical protein